MTTLLWTNSTDGLTANRLNPTYSVEDDLLPLPTDDSFAEPDPLGAALAQAAMEAVPTENAEHYRDMIAETCPRCRSAPDVNHLCNACEGRVANVLHREAPLVPPDLGAMLAAERRQSEQRSASPLVYNVHPDSDTDILPLPSLLPATEQPVYNVHPDSDEDSLPLPVMFSSGESQPVGNAAGGDLLIPPDVNRMIANERRAELARQQRSPAVEYGDDLLPPRI